MNQAIARTPVDGYQVPWASFAEFFKESGPDPQAKFLTELDTSTGGSRMWTGGEWRSRVLETAEWLMRAGVGAGDSVATLLGNTADALAVAFATWVMGARCVPLNPEDSPARHLHILRDSGAVLLMHGLKAPRLAWVDKEQIGTRAVHIEKLVDALASGELTGAGLPEGDLNSTALLVYTSGTSGEPKGVALSAGNLLVDCHALSHALRWPKETRILTVLPVHHVNGLVISSLLPWYAGLSTVLCDRFRSELFWRLVEQERATVCSMVPSLLEFLLKGDGSAPPHFSEVLCGAGPLLTTTAVDFEARFRVPIRHLYGLSETTAVVTITPRVSEERRRQLHTTQATPSIGVAVPHAEVAIQDLHGRDVPAGTRGEIVVRGAMVMQGYLGQPDSTQVAFRGGWFHTGDEGYFTLAPTGERYFYITGRLKELIIRGGTNISPLEIDSVLRQHPGVAFGLAVGFENRIYGEEIAAYVVPAYPITEDEILRHCANYLPHSRQPKVIIQGADIPLASTGKPKRLELQERLKPFLSQYRETTFRRRLGDSGG